MVDTSEEEISRLRARLAELEGSTNSTGPAPIFSAPPAIQRQVSWLLGAGILFFPIVFAWLLLRPGYSRRARVLSFGWLCLGAAYGIVVASVHSPTLTQATVGSSQAKPPLSASTSPMPPTPATTSAPSAAVAAPVDTPIDLSSAEALDDKYGMEATASCDTYADDYIRTIAKYDFKWDDSAKGLFGTKFDKFRKAVDAPGVLTMVSDKLALQNGFGAYERSLIFCKYNTQKKDDVPSFEMEADALGGEGG